MGDRNQVIGNTSWIHRLPPYLYVSALVHGKRVLELGCGSGDGARFLAGCGAASVTAVDPRERVLEQARRRHRAAGLSFERRDLDDLEFHDNAFHCAFVPEAGALLRDSDAVVELRRVLSPRGQLVACAPATGPGALDYDEFVALLEPSFGPPTMIAQGPFVAVSLVEYAERDGVVPSVELDTSLLARGGGEQVARYVAVCGARPAQARPLAIVQVPANPGLAALASSDGDASAPWGDSDEPRDDGDGAREQADADDGDAQRARAAKAPREASRSASDRAAQVAPRDAAPGARDDAAPASQPAETAETASRGAPDPQARGWDGSVSQRIAGALEAHASHAATLERALQDQRAYVAEMERELADAEQRIAREVERRAGVEAQLARRDGELKEWRHRASVAEGEVLKVQLAAAEESPRPASPAAKAADLPRVEVINTSQAQRVANLERLVADLERMLADRDRMLADRDRMLADRDRALEERAKAHAEQARAQAEQTQAEAEQARETDWAHDQQAEELAELRRKLERATANWREAETKNDDVWRRVGELQNELERHREESVARSAKQAQDARVQLAHAREDGIQKVVAVREQLRQSEAAQGELERALHAERAGRRELEAKLAEREQSSAREGNGAARRIGEVRQELRAVADALAAERDAARSLEAGLAALEQERRERGASTPAESRAQELAFELGVKDAELMLLGSGVAALQERLANVRARVERARTEMADGDAAALRAVMERLAAEVSRLAGLDHA